MTRQGRTFALATLFAVFESGVELETCALFVVHPLPLVGAPVVMVNEAVALGAMTPTTQRTVRFDARYVQLGADTYGVRDGSVSTTTTSRAVLGPLFVRVRPQTAVEPVNAPVFTSARSAGGVTSW